MSDRVGKWVPLVVMTDTILFDFVNRQVVVLSASGQSSPVPKDLVLQGTGVPPRSQPAQ